MTRWPAVRLRWYLVVVFAIAMAWVEAACVYYLRVLVDRVNPYQPDPLPIHGVLGQVELVREAATLVMLLTVGILAGTAWRSRAGYAAIAFGVWDISYYVFLRVMCGWPSSLFDWDILFLIPLPWWGPVLAPVTIAVLLVVWGSLVCGADGRGAVTSFTKVEWGSSATGIAIALYLFMADALRAAGQGIDVRTMPLPTTFNWGVFSLAFVLMALPVVSIARRRRP